MFDEPKLEIYALAKVFSVKLAFTQNFATSVSIHVNPLPQCSIPYPNYCTAVQSKYYNKMDGYCTVSMRTGLLRLIDQLQVKYSMAIYMQALSAGALP